MRWPHVGVVLALGALGQEDFEFKASLDLNTGVNLKSA